MSPIGRAVENILPVVAAAIVRQEDGVALTGRPFRGIVREEGVLNALATHVMRLTNGE